ncbi:glycoside hydrolase family 97 protein [Bacteroides difficilis]|uniref:Glycoside hydrolase family 97 protein n=1 Tax=Bacteroides difficilis TaxID=2763021 RepID=A0ABR7C665_9BACE|nr:glycoside hydrolase family 97 protein [Bacteroides difficilis]MBC5603279.1 glycoside hydrolase family 97 protein [Bacteroides difficilis]
MNLLSRKWTAILLIAVPFWANAQKGIELKDPSGKIQLNVMLGNTVTYSVSHGEDVIIGTSPVSMTLTDGTVFGKEPRLKKKKYRTENQMIYPPIYRKQSIKDHFNELTLEFKGGYSLVFRAYEDGVAYRFISDLKKPFMVESEQAVFNLPNNPKVFAATPKGRKIDGVENQYHSSFQNTYRYVELSKWDKSRLAFLPVLSESENGKKVCITEADLLNYPGMFLKVSSDNKGFYGEFAAYPKDISVEVRGLKGMVKTREPYIAKVEGKTVFPWRVMVISEKDTDLLCSDMVYKLATPAAEADYSWIKPGKVAWDWWNDWNLYGVDFRAGVNTETYKYYIDFASKFGIEYVILDEGWAVAGPADLFQIVPEIDMEELIRYADSKKVGLILWAGYRAFDLDMERVCKHYSAMGIKGFKIDFMDRDDQYMVDFNRRCAETGAKYKLLIDLHGTHKPTGLQRTYPNAINFEGVHGLEEMKWAQPGTDQVTYDVTMPFIRMVAGPLDYTQGAMNNANKENFKAVYSEPMSQGTRCRQLAQYIIFDSPLNMLCDAPTNYLKEEECTKFIAAIPTVWEETKALCGEVGKYLAMVRQKNDVWYVGALTNWDSRDMELDLSFLGEGEYKAEIFEDGINADRVGKDYKRKVIPVPADRRLKIHMVSGGGHVMRIWK